MACKMQPAGLPAARESCKGTTQLVSVLRITHPVATCKVSAGGPSSHQKDVHGKLHSKLPRAQNATQNQRLLVPFSSSATLPEAEAFAARDERTWEQVSPALLCPLTHSLPPPSFTCLHPLFVIDLHRSPLFCSI